LQHLPIYNCGLHDAFVDRNAVFTLIHGGLLYKAKIHFSIQIVTHQKMLQMRLIKTFKERLRNINTH